MIYAIGDLHGRLPLLETIYDAILQDIAQTKEEYNEIVYLGDYIDRGPDSKLVLDFLISLKDTENLKHICLLGNHEDFLLQAMDNFGTSKDYAIYQCWMQNGGLETLDSFGIVDYQDTARQIFKPYVKWLKSLPTYYEKHNYIFCHSGYIRTDFSISLDAQRDNLLWGRPHKNMYAHYNKWVIHGHTPTANYKPTLEYHRVNLDTDGWYIKHNWMHAGVFPNKECISEDEIRFIKITV